ncbi:hypothetical protein JOF56_009546 [Kibdelosporangium banguiense]|uniref:Uncharacterized protein n=1 Tax=Kibdelosporangium banguiense TaxID=1365924 RepID=A0ABS4TXN8_9PSEU|nr:hypothetical protein [Kibdelosporangium banguiense]
MTAWVAGGVFAPKLRLPEGVELKTFLLCDKWFPAKRDEKTWRTRNQRKKRKKRRRKILPKI